MTDAAAPRAADPDGPVPGQPAGADASADPAAAESDLAAALAAALAAVVFADERLAAFDASIRAMAGLLAVDRVLQVIVDRVRELVGAGYAALGIVDGEGVIEQFITSGMPRAERALIGAPPRGLGILGLIIRENRAYRIVDVMDDPRRHGFPPNHPPMHAFLGVPVAIRGRTIGNLYLTEKAGGFTEADQQIVELFAGHAAIAMENARLHDQVQRLAIVEERERIGRDLHDGVIQSIYAVGLTLEDVPDLMVEDPAEACRRVERAIESLDQTIRDIRNFIFGLRPELLETAGLIEGLAALVDESRINTMIDLELSTEGIAGDELAVDARAQLLQIAREALSNVARHSGASRATVRVDRVDDRLRLAVSDDGVGFDPGADRGTTHRGLANMRARAAALGGALVVDSIAGSGTRLVVQVPINGPIDL